MECPNCRFVNRTGAFCSNCGYSFVGRTLPAAGGGDTIPPNLASLGDRFLAQVLDTMIAVTPVIFAFLVGLVWRPAGIVMAIPAILFALFYLLFADGFRGGQSFGKKMLGMAVINAATGRACTLAESFIRNLLLALLGWIDWIFILGKRRQRLGDRAARTLVIKRIPV